MKDRSLSLGAPLAHRLARLMVTKLPANVELDDLTQAAMVGLWKAEKKFDPTLGVQPQTYATHRITGAMLDQMRQEDVVSRSDRRKMRQVAAAENLLLHQLGRRPLASEIAAKLDITLEEYYELLERFNTALLAHLEDMTGDDGDQDFLGRYVPIETDDPFSLLEAKQGVEMVVSAIETLPDRERAVLRMYYEEDMELSEIGKKLGVSASRVCQIHSACLKRLRKKVQAVTTERPSKPVPTAPPPGPQLITRLDLIPENYRDIIK